MPTPPKTLTADAILSRKIPEKIIDVPEIGGKIKVRQYLVADHIWVAEKVGPNPDPTGLEDLTWTLIRCCVEPKFEESQFADLKAAIPTTALIDISAAIGQMGGAASVKAAEKSPVAG